VSALLELRDYSASTTKRPISSNPPLRVHAPYTRSGLATASMRASIGRHVDHGPTACAYRGALRMPTKRGSLPERLRSGLFDARMRRAWCASRQRMPHCRCDDRTLHELRWTASGSVLRGDRGGRRGRLLPDSVPATGGRRDPKSPERRRITQHTRPLNSVRVGCGNLGRVAF